MEKRDKIEIALLHPLNAHLVCLIRISQNVVVAAAAADDDDDDDDDSCCDRK